MTTSRSKLRVVRSAANAGSTCCTSPATSRWTWLYAKRRLTAESVRTPTVRRVRVFARLDRESRRSHPYPSSNGPRLQVGTALVLPTSLARTACGCRALATRGAGAWRQAASGRAEFTDSTAPVLAGLVAEPRRELNALDRIEALVAMNASTGDHRVFVSRRPPVRAWPPRSLSPLLWRRATRRNASAAVQAPGTRLGRLSARLGGMSIPGRHTLHHGASLSRQRRAERRRRARRAIVRGARAPRGQSTGWTSPPLHSGASCPRR